MLAGGFVAVLCALGLYAWLGARQQAVSLARPAVTAQAGPQAVGAAAMIGADFGGLGTQALRSHALPWRLMAAALVLEARRADPALAEDTTTLHRVLAGFGFLVDARLVNAPAGIAGLNRELPLGLTHGDLSPVGGSRVRVANLACAACHAGVTYGADGMPRPQAVWLGAPNTSIDLEAYTLAAFRALRAGLQDRESLLATAGRLFPDMDAREALSLRWLVLPLVEARMRELGPVDRPLPFTNGLPGSTNGVAALKMALGVPLMEGGPADAGIVSVPELADRVLRRAVLVDSAYAVPGAQRGQPTTPADVTPRHLSALALITTFFTVPSMGVPPDQASAHQGDAEAIMAFLREVRPQPFPGALDRAAAEVGRGVYEARCAACHGSHGPGLDAPRLERFANWSGDVGTDTLRARAFTPELARAVSASPHGRHMDVVSSGLYAAPPLTGVWRSAPYLHNGSVPTLAALLSPDQRPVRFRVGGHKLDLERVGIALGPDGDYPARYRPFSGAAWVDTTRPGLGNQGHEFGADLSARDKAALIEYLKHL
jgi:cytochrome c5